MLAYSEVYYSSLLFLTEWVIPHNESSLKNAPLSDNLLLQNIAALKHDPLRGSLEASDFKLQPL